MNATSRSALSLLALAALAAIAAVGHSVGHAADATASAPARAVSTVPGMPPVVDPNNLYSETAGPEHVGPALKDDLVRVYVPNLRGNSCLLYTSPSPRD